MKDRILEKFFEFDRWVKAIEKGVVKDIKKSELIKLTSEETRMAIASAIIEGKYNITPPHTAKIPKDNGDYRTVYVNEPIDRVILSIANDLLFELAPEMIHKSCKSYQVGIGCGKVVLEVSRTITDMKSKNFIVGWKSDLSKYFDSVPIQYIDKAFDMVEKKHGKSALIDILRKYYHCNYYFDENNELKQNYQSLKQGCAVAAWLANVILYDIDKKLSELDGYYVRYSDDMLFVGKDYEKAMLIMKDMLNSMKMKINPKKVEYLRKNVWFKFLGYSIKGGMISLSSTRIKTFQKEIEQRTIRKRNTSLKSAVDDVNRYMYKGNGEFRWATQVLPVCNVLKDLNELNKFVMDCLRAVETGKKKVGGLGYMKDKADGCVVRGRGRNVKANRSKTDKIEGYLTIGCMYNAIRTRKAVYATLVNTL